MVALLIKYLFYSVIFGQGGNFLFILQYQAVRACCRLIDLVQLIRANKDLLWFVEQTGGTLAINETI